MHLFVSYLFVASNVNLKIDKPFSVLFFMKTPLFQVRVENVKDPINHVQGVLDRVREEYLLKTYSIEPWSDMYDFLTKICVKAGRLLKVIVRLFMQ